MTKGLIDLLKTKLFHLTSQEKKDEVIFVSFIILVATAFVFAFLYIFLKLYYLAVENAFTGILFFLGGISFKKKLFSKKSIMSFGIAGAFIHVFFVVLATGATQSPALPWFILIPLAAAFFTSSLSFCLWVITVTVSFPLLHFIKNLQSVSPLLVALPEHVFQIIQSSSYLFVILIAALWIYFYGKAVTKNVEEVLESKESMAELIRLLTHDIAGPLSVIKAYGELLETSPTNTSIKEKAVKGINRNAVAIESLINKIRELRALESGKRILKTQRTDLRDCIRRSLELVQERFEEKNITLSFSTQGNDFFAFVEPEVLALQVLPNLLHNALKFSHGQSRVGVFLNSTEDFITIAVQDKGLGIPKEILKNIFSYEKSTTREGTQGEKGTGFGMPLVKSFVEKMSGTIEIKSVSINDSLEDHGTTVFVRFMKA